MLHIYTTHKFIEEFIRYILCIYEYKIMALTWIWTFLDDRADERVVTYSTVKKNDSFDLYFCLLPLCDYSAICCMNGKTIQCLSKPWQHLPIYLKQFSSYWNRKCKKYPFWRTAAHIFVKLLWPLVSWKRPCDYHAICYMVGKKIEFLQMSGSVYLFQ